MKQPKFALVIAKKQKPTPGVEIGDKWLDFLASLNRTSPPIEGSMHFHDNVWLLPLENGLSFLCKMIEWAGQFSVSIRILFLDELPDWTKYPPAAKEKP